MPLFMDFHKFDRVTVEDVKTAHIADQAIQDQYGVRYLQFWVNEEAGTVFCLTEGPDKESCELVHKMAHGNTACALVEVEPGFYKMMMGEQHHLDHGLVSKEDGTLDLGYRTILCVRANTTSVGHDQTNEKRVVTERINFFNGRVVRWDHDESVIGVFNDSTDALKCAIALQKLASQHKFSVRIGIATDQPVTKDGDFFSEAIEHANYLSVTARENEVNITDLTRRLTLEGVIKSDTKTIHLIDDPDLTLLSNFLSATEKHLADESFTIDSLCHEVGLSRPQLYRKITSLSGRAPNDFVRDIRIEKAWTLLKRKKGNISQVAMQVGYNNPSYFAKCFTEKYGITPSKFIQQTERQADLNS